MAVRQPNNNAIRLFSARLDLGHLDIDAAAVDANRKDASESKDRGEIARVLHMSAGEIDQP